MSDLCSRDMISLHWCWHWRKESMASGSAPGIVVTYRINWS